MLKRTFDLFMVLSVLLFLSPFFLCIAFIIKKYDGGPVFYRGERTGLRGAPFQIYKFRTMVVDAEKLGGAS
ncbi:MAG TPA: sugar transferase, partial [Syntrophales bacterium]|nr:sugar transferase [Syntrophales bacterium]